MSDQFKRGDWSELKRLAERENQLFEEATPESDSEWPAAHDELAAALVGGCFTKTILALIVENERLQAERDAIAKSQRYGQDAVAIAVERDQLRAENERLQNLACAVNSAMHAAGMPVDADPAELADVIHRLQVQVATLQSSPNSWQSGYDKGRADGTRARLSELEQERRINAELRAEVEALRSGIDPSWKLMDQSILNHFLRNETNFDADKIDRMIQFAIDAAMGKGGRADG